MTRINQQTDIQDFLYRLGATSNYTGTSYTAYALTLCRERADRLLLVTKWLYPDVARHYGTSWSAVERNIRTVSKVIWRENRALLEILAGKQLPRQPSATQLLAILTHALL